MPAVLTAALLVSTAFPSCSSRGGQTTIRVLAASSLTNGLGDVARQFEAKHPGINVSLSFAGSDILARQITQGAPADVFASADPNQMKVVVKDGDNTADPVNFATNELTIIMPKDNPADIQSIADLARPGVKLVLAAPEVPAGHYARTVLDKAGIGGKVDVVSNEQDVEGVVSKVRLGEADAGICYVTDVSPDVSGQLSEVTIPPADNVVATYQIAPVSNSDPGMRFTGYVISNGGTEVLRSYGFGSPAKR